MNFTDGELIFYENLMQQKPGTGGKSWNNADLAVNHPCRRCNTPNRPNCFDHCTKLYHYLKGADN